MIGLSVYCHDVQLHTGPLVLCLRIISLAADHSYDVTRPAIRTATTTAVCILRKVVKYRGETHISSSSQSRVQVSLHKHPPTNNEINGTFIFKGLLSLLLTEEDKDDQKDCNSLHSGSRHPGQASYQDAVTLYSYVPPAAAYQEDQ